MTNELAFDKNSINNLKPLTSAYDANSIISELNKMCDQLDISIAEVNKRREETRRWFKKAFAIMYVTISLYIFELILLLMIALSWTMQLLLFS